MLDLSDLSKVLPKVESPSQAHELTEAEIKRQETVALRAILSYTQEYRDTLMQMIAGAEGNKTRHSEHSGSWDAWVMAIRHLTAEREAVQAVIDKLFEDPRIKGLNLAG